MLIQGDMDITLNTEEQTIKPPHALATHREVVVKVDDEFLVVGEVVGVNAPSGVAGLEQEGRRHVIL